MSKYVSLAQFVDPRRLLGQTEFKLGGHYVIERKKQEIIKAYQREEGDTGSPEVQVAILTYTINTLNEHLKNIKKTITLVEVF